MLIKIFLFTFLTTLLYAIPTVDIHSKNISLKNFKLEYFVDAKHSMQLDEVMEQNFTPYFY